MRYDPEKHHRQSIRLNGFDYSMEGAYFVTIVAQNRECAFGKIVNGEMQLNDVGRIVQECWNAIPNHHPGIELDEFVIMPNHMHGIVVIAQNHGGDVPGRGVPGRGVQLNAPTRNPTRNPNNRMSVVSPYHNTLSVVIRTFKAAVTTATRQTNRHNFAWQRNYYEHIVRNERSLNRIREYIANNPANWNLDGENLNNGNHETQA